MIISKEHGELVVLHETPIDTQKKLRTWLSTNYSITIISQVSMDKWLVTTLVRNKI